LRFEKSINYQAKLLIKVAKKNFFSQSPIGAFLSFTTIGGGKYSKIT
jgi:hypothetical protein